MAQENYDHQPMDLTELIRTVRGHDRDLYKGNGKAALFVRVTELETYRERTEADLYDPETGAIPKLKDFFAVLVERERRASTTTKVYVALVAVIPIMYDVLSHYAGWR
jgi:hypothetical protein